jgi:hypothetical protein
MLVAAFASACGGGSNLPNGSVVNSPGGSGHPPTKLVNVKVVVTVPRGAKQRMRPGYVSVNTESLSIQLVSVDGGGVTGVNATTVNTTAHSHGCKVEDQSTTCTGSAYGSPGQDVFAVTTYSATNATGSVLSVGTVQAKIAGNGGNVNISNTLSLTLDGVIASLKLALSPNWAKRGTPTKSGVTLAAFDATGAEIVGPSRYASPIALDIQGDTDNAFTLHAAGKSGSSLTIVKPTSGIAMNYDGNAQASPVTLQASVDGPSSISKSAPFDLRGKQQPPPVGTIYALNLGANDGLAATVTEYDGKAKGNAAPVRTLQLSAKLYARTIGVDSSGNLYVGYFDNEFGHGGTGLPDSGNEIAIYAPDASGTQQPAAVLTADKSTKTALFPIFIAFDPSGDLVTYGATGVDGNDGNDAVLTYPPGSKNAAAPTAGFDFATPTITYSGPTGLAIDASGNFYVNGALHTSLGPDYGLFVAAAKDAGNPSATPIRTIPWNGSNGLTPGLTTLVTLDSSGEILIGNAVLQGSGTSASCQGRASVYPPGTGGGSSPLRILTLDGIFTTNSLCASARDPRSAFFPSIAMYATSLFVADDFNNAIAAYPADAHGSVKPSLQITGAATGLSAPIALVITSVSGRATARPARPFDALNAR